MSTARHGRVVDAARTPADRIVEYTGSDGTRRIGLKGDRLVAVEAEPGWDDFPDAAALVNGDRPVEAWRVDLFAERGRLSIEGTIPNADGSTAAAGDCDEVVCHCRQVARSRIAQLVAEGRSVDAISQLTGAGTVCGGCGPLIGEIAGRSTMQPARLVGRERLDSVHSRFTFAVDGPAEPALPGASVVLQVEIDGRRITRSYTLTGADAEAGTREITVRREPNGLFSRWLHDHAADDARFRMSSPIGGKAIDPDEPMTFIAGGVGITPALSRLKAMAAAGRGRLRLHWSARFEEGSALTEEVRELVAAIPGAEAVLRNTLAEGRMTAEDWRRFAPFDGTGTINVCGPVTFMEDAAAANLRGRMARPDRTNAGVNFRLRTGAPAPKAAGKLSDQPMSNTCPVAGKLPTLPPQCSVVEEPVLPATCSTTSDGAHKVFEDRSPKVEAEHRRDGKLVHTYENELAMAAAGSSVAKQRALHRRSPADADRLRCAASKTEEEVSGDPAHLRFGTNGGDLRPCESRSLPARGEAEDSASLNPQSSSIAGHRSAATCSVTGRP